MLAGKVVAVTGGGRGIGRAIALACAREGAAVVVNDAGVAVDGAGSDAAPADAVVAEIGEAGGRAVANRASVADPAAAATIVEDAITAFGRIDAVVNNAGILRDAIWHRLSYEDWRAVIDVHLHGAFNVSKAATQHFRNQGSGAFVHLTSEAGLVGNVGQANYAAAKMGIVGLSQSIALDAARYGVRSNCIAPVAFTRMMATVNPGEEPDPAMAAMGPDKVAPLAAFLLSDAGAGVTNQVFAVHGDEIVLYGKMRPIRALAHSEGWTPLAIAETLLPQFRPAFPRADEVAADLFGRTP